MFLQRDENMKTNINVCVHNNGLRGHIMIKNVFKTFDFDHKCCLDVKTSQEKVCSEGEGPLVS